MEKPAASCRLFGGGSSKFGKLEAACRRCVKLDGALRASKDDPMWKGTVATVASVSDIAMKVLNGRDRTARY